ncbi:MAG: potassium-transporting ATPase subunit F [Cellulomonas sp.]|nr:MULTISPECIES: potassium-transporting ATPase subunit F [Cellulomonas]MCR6648124.1 potassium-transporting ATPase subunit F [Cellulomonas sp.]MCR6704055.1 potassium-transporting ATPase subunit F [Cellulomonas sp.]
MTASDIAALVVAAGLLVYLVVQLVRADKVG